MLENSVKDRLARDEVVVGTFIMEFASPGLARIVAAAGCDFVVLDMEHSGFSFETVKQQVAHARGAGLVPVVNPRGGHRFAENEQLLDIGAMGLMVPCVETRTQAEAIVRGTRYPPDGTRGAAFGVAHDGYRVGDVPAVMKRANASSLVTVKIETAEGVRNAERDHRRARHRRRRDRPYRPVAQPRHSAAARASRLPRRRSTRWSRAPASTARPPAAWSATSRRGGRGSGAASA